jgi:CxxC motif-containing protein
VKIMAKNDIICTGCPKGCRVTVDIENDEIIELSKLEKEFGFSSKKDINNYIKIIERLLKNKEVIQTIKEQTSKLL